MGSNRSTAQFKSSIPYNFALQWIRTFFCYASLLVLFCHYFKLSLKCWNYVASYFRLCEENINEFDPHINNVHLQECLKRLLYAYDDLNYISERDGNDRDVFNVFLDTNRPYFESLYILLNLGNSTAILRGLQLSKIWRFVISLILRHCEIVYL